MRVLARVCAWDVACVGACVGAWGRVCVLLFPGVCMFGSVCGCVSGCVCG